MGLGDRLRKILSQKPQRPRTESEKLLKFHLEEVTGWENEFQYHDVRVETLEKAINSITLARNLVDTAIRELRVETYRKMKDGFEGTFDDRTNYLHFRLATLNSRRAREMLTVDVADTVAAALAAAGSSDIPPHLVEQSHYIEPWDAQTITDQSSILTRDPMDAYDLPDDIRDILADPSEEEPIIAK